MSDGNQRSRIDLLHGWAATLPALLPYPSLPGPVWRAADHLVILTEPTQAPALLAARFGTTGRDPYLWLAARADRRVAGRLVSALLLCLAAEEDLPAALIAERRDPVMAETMEQLAHTIPGSTLYPRPRHNVIPLRSAAMTRRIARTVGVPDILVLDLRSTDEAIMTPAMTQFQRAHAS